MNIVHFFRFHQHQHHHAATTYTQILYLIILCLLLVLYAIEQYECVSALKTFSNCVLLYAPFCLVIRKRGSSIIVIIIVIQARLFSVALSCSGPFTFYGNVLNLCLWIYPSGSFVLKSFFFLPLGLGNMKLNYTLTRTHIYRKRNYIRSSFAENVFCRKGRPHEHVSEGQRERRKSIKMECCM